jgi:NAD(P)H-dependent flavin oxidoreductase YrpB (nitropropane dioxygenase family)
MVLTTRVTQLLGIEHPIIQGGMHYVGYASLAAAVSNAGGLGTITALTAGCSIWSIQPTLATRDWRLQPIHQLLPASMVVYVTHSDTREWPYGVATKPPPIDGSRYSLCNQPSDTRVWRPSLPQRSPEDLRAEIRKCKQLCPIKPFAVNFTLLPSLAPPNYGAYAAVIVEEGVPVVETAVGGVYYSS